jgi:hypothetical protein
MGFSISCIEQEAQDEAEAAKEIMEWKKRMGKA